MTENNNLSPINMQYTESYIIKGNTLNQILNNLMTCTEEHNINSAWSIQIFEIKDDGWRALLTKAIGE